MEGETTYTIDEAAAILEKSPERVWEMLITGELDGIPPGATVSGEWKVLLPSTLGEDKSQHEPPVEESPDSVSEGQEEAPAAGESGEEFVAPPETDAQSEEPPPASEASSRGDKLDCGHEVTAPSGWVSTQQAARTLGMSPGTVRWHIEQGNLDAKPEGEGVRRSWLVSIDSLQPFMDARQAAGEMPRDRRAAPETLDIATQEHGEAIRVLAERLEDAAARAAEYRVMLEFTAHAESTLRAELEEERRKREAAERERDELRRRLESRPEPREAPVSLTPTEESPSGTGGGPQDALRASLVAKDFRRIGMTQFYDRQTMERLHQHLARADLELRDTQHILAPDSAEEAEMDIVHAVSAARLGVTTALERVRTQLGVPAPQETLTEATEQPGRVGPQTPREPSGMHMPEAGGGPLPHDQQTPSERPWWRRMFGG
jgi:hypothetical protein